MVTLRLSHAPKADGYRYFWAKGVEGFDAGKCCQASLRGPRIRGVSLVATGEIAIAVPSPFLYVCGSLGEYATNVHVAMRPEPGESFTETTSTGLVIEVTGARRVEIPTLDDVTGISDQQRRCRNFRFGYGTFVAMA